MIAHSNIVFSATISAIAFRLVRVFMAVIVIIRSWIVVRLLIVATLAAIVTTVVSAIEDVDNY